MRKNNRAADELRNMSIRWGIQPNADSSLLIGMGDTQVICAVTVEESVPPFLKEKGQGWITAEYAMLPCATAGRNRREHHGPSGRSSEIQRLIGRSLRMMVDLSSIGERTLRVDCDVLNADGGTRTASITGGALVVRDALRGLVSSGKLAELPKILPVAAISAGIVGGQAYLDLDYSEDSQAEVDANFIMAGDNRWIEIQATAEGQPFEEESFFDLRILARKGIRELFNLWS